VSTGNYYELYHFSKRSAASGDEHAKLAHEREIEARNMDGKLKERE